MRTEKDIVALIENDRWMMEVISAAQSLDLPDWWVCAGFVRAKIWDALHGFSERTRLGDIDVIYFDPVNLLESDEKWLEKKLDQIMPGLPWSVKNQARMHLVNGLDPYSSSADAISKFPETATALGVKMDKQGAVVLTAPCGIDGVLHMKVKVTPHFAANSRLLAIFNERLKSKNWQATWDKLIYEPFPKGRV